MAVISLNIAAMHVKKNIDYNMKQNAKSERLHYAMRFYSGSLKAAIWVTSQSAFCLFHMINKNHHFIHAAVHGFVTDVHMPTIYAHGKRKGNDQNAHFVDTLFQQIKEKPVRS